MHDEHDEYCEEIVGPDEEEAFQRNQDIVFRFNKATGFLLADLKRTINQFQFEQACSIHFEEAKLATPCDPTFHYFLELSLNGKLLTAALFMANVNDAEEVERCIALADDVLRKGYASPYSLWLKEGVVIAFLAHAKRTSEANRRRAALLKSLLYLRPYKYWAKRIEELKQPIED